MFLGLAPWKSHLESLRSEDPMQRTGTLEKCPSRHIKSCKDFKHQNENKVNILLGAGKILGGLPECTLNLQNYKKECPGRFPSSLGLVCFKVFIILVGQRSCWKN